MALAAVVLAVALGLAQGTGTLIRRGDEAASSGEAERGASTSVPSWATWSDSLLACDLDGDGLPEGLWLKDCQLAIYGRDADQGEGADRMSTLSVEDGLSVCRTSDDWLVSVGLVGDIDHEGTPELVLLVWAPGSYGPSQPFWVDDETNDYREHVYLLRYEQGRLVPVWMSSALEVEATDATLDAEGRLHLRARDGSETCWAWQSWGLKLVGTDDAASAAEGGLTIVAVGDNIAHRGVLAGARSSGGDYDFTATYREIASWVSSFDLAVVGQEAPLLPYAQEGTPVCGAPFAMGDALVAAGFDVVLNASNHVGDFGVEALRGELAFWRDAHPEVLVLGIHGSACEPRYRIVEQRGVRIALFDYTQSTGRGSRLSEDESRLVDRLVDEDRLREDLGDVEGQVDLSLCFLHTGPEGSQLPDERQWELCQRLVDAGADVVVCSHAHTVMPLTRIETEAGNQGVVYYGLGNFVSSSHGRSSVLEGAAALTLRVESSGDGERTVAGIATMVPLVCHADGDGTRVYRLCDYTDDLASTNRLLAEDGEGVAGLARQWLMDIVADPQAIL